MLARQLPVRLLDFLLGGRLEDGLMARLSEATGRTVIYNNLGQTMRDPDAWKKHMARLEETSEAGIRAFPLAVRTGPRSTSR